MISEGFCFGTDLDPYPSIMQSLPHFLNGTIAALSTGSNICTWPRTNYSAAVSVVLESAGPCNVSPTRNHMLKIALKVSMYCMPVYSNPHRHSPKSCLSKHTYLRYLPVTSLYKQTIYYVHSLAITTQETQSLLPVQISQILDAMVTSIPKYHYLSLS
jgi:hypothetical protein